ncbi:L-ascorbate metabolism protein UlaG (beta-lactamase superfamily) [Chitinophaga skermanii]|uniref:L-ascorbate metabolism protein UlaG (Beta-lactamase superfamily) n=1 Tax=Chitinophaga skermanii TaxID=331697 RepID=A0A327QI56_9BACT|nr:MBL fold metallo-hydrolase [Chitinophaga skermanii]RAJ04249.1 L-ascorbate metabolism protein UlaG (beta-lactamase superfamily) [Chitinophaga skermanii]
MTILFVIILTVITIIYWISRTRAFGQKPSGERLQRLKQSPHYKNGTFQNPQPTVLGIKGNAWTVMRRFFKRDPRKKPAHALPVVHPTQWTRPNDVLAVTWFGHSSYLLQIEGLNILVDPVFSERTSPFTWLGNKNFEGTGDFGVKDLPKLDVVIITHDHYDHLDYHTILQLVPRAPRFITPLGVGAHLESWGIPSSDIQELDWWQHIDIQPGMQLTATPARHFSGRAFNRNNTLWTSYVMKTSRCNLFIGGDSGYGAHFKEIGEKMGPFDLAILESGQYNEFWPDIHMMPEETVHAAADLQAKALLPVHWGKYVLSMHPWEEPPERVSAEIKQYNIELLTPMIGETIVLDQPNKTGAWWSRLK